MAKGNFILGTVAGKIGDVVAYKVKNSNNKQVQGLRRYQAKVANPQTSKQMAQRWKLSVLQNFFRGLQTLLDHSWQGIAYGDPSRRHFMKITMQKDFEGMIPYLLKSDKRFVPGELPIATGSIPVDCACTVGQSAIVCDGINYPDGEFSTIGDLSNALIGENLGLQNGDQLTFIGVYGNSGNYVPTYARLVLDTASTTPLTSLAVILSQEATNDKLQFNFGTDAPQAGAVIISRYANNAWQRSNSTMAVADAVRDFYATGQQYDAMMESYVTTGDQSSDWYLNQADTDASSIGGALGYMSLTGFEAPNTALNGQNVQVWKNGNSVVAAVVNNATQQYLLDANGNTLDFKYLGPERPGEDPTYETRPLTKADVPALATLPYVVKN